MEIDSVTETFCSSENQTMDKKPKNQIISNVTAMFQISEESNALSFGAE
jgi:hypothetical protein